MQNIKMKLLMATAVIVPGLSLPAVVQASSIALADRGSEGNPRRGVSSQIGDEIVVTAQHRKEFLSKVPIAATAIDAQTLTEKGVKSITDLSDEVPGVHIMGMLNTGGPQITIRGIGASSYVSNTEATAALYLDGFVVNPNNAKAAQLFDLARVEVLRGPQGTLYGKNSTSGAINFITNRPSGKTAAEAQLTVGRWGEVDGEAAAETGLSDTLSLRIAAKHDGSDGYGFNVTTGKRVYGMNTTAARVGLRYLTDDVDIFLKVFGDVKRTNGSPTKNYAVSLTTGNPLPSNTNPITGFKYPSGRDVFADGLGKSHVDNEGAGLNVDYNLKDYTLSSITGIIRSNNHEQYTIDGQPTTFSELQVPLGHTKVWEATQELRITSPQDGRLTWLGGLVYFHQHANYDNDYDLTGFFRTLPIIKERRVEEINSYAAYADGKFDFGGGFSAIAGVRITDDIKKFDSVSAFSLVGPINVHIRRSWTEPSYRAGLNYQSGDTLFYVQYNRGFRSGAFDTGFTSSPGQLLPVNPEFVDNYESGVKTTMFDRHLRISAAIYYESLKDQQALILKSCAAGDPTCTSFQILANAGKARNYGVELEGVAKFASNFDLNFSGEYSNSKYIKFISGTDDFSGQPLANAPKYRIRIAPEYRIPLNSGSLFLAPSANFVGKARTVTAPGRNGYELQNAYTDIDAQAGYRGDAYSVFGWVKNATNERHLVYGGGGAATGFSTFSYVPPTSYGVTLSAKFR